MRLQCSQCRGVTLIETLIVISMMTIIVNAFFLVYVAAVRAERGITRQQEAMQELALLERTWRGDVHAAKAVLSRSSRQTLALDVHDAGTSTTGRRAYIAAPQPDGKFTVDRVRLDARGTTISVQRLATALDSVSFDEDTTSGMQILSVSTTHGYYPHNPRQQFSALAALGKEF